MSPFGQAYLLRTVMILAAIILLMANERRAPQPDLAASPAAEGADYVKCRAD